MTVGYNGTSNADDPLVQPWYIQGWTAQAIGADTIEASPAGLSAPANFPQDLVFVLVTHGYFDLDQSPLGGFLTFMMSDNVSISSGGNTIRMPARLAGWDASQTGFSWANWGSGKLYIRNGQVSVLLLATDNAGMTTDSGAPLTYWVSEHMMGGRTFQITAPSASSSPADLDSLIVAGSVQPYQYDPVNPMGNLLIPVPPPSNIVVPASSSNDFSVIDGGSA